jgi:hypothetical protein
MHMRQRNESRDELCYFHRNHYLISDNCQSSGANLPRIENMYCLRVPKRIMRNLKRSYSEIEDALDTRHLREELICQHF